MNNVYLKLVKVQNELKAPKSQYNSFGKYSYRNLEFIQNERLKLQEKYLKEVKNIWIEFEGIEADKKHKKLYNEYKNKDYFLEGLQARLESILEEIEIYKENK